MCWKASALLAFKIEILNSMIEKIMLERRERVICKCKKEEISFALNTTRNSLKIHKTSRKERSETEEITSKKAR